MRVNHANQMADLLIYIHNAWWNLKVNIQPRTENSTYCSCYASVPKGYNVQMSFCFTLTICQAMVGDKVLW